jgi:hypothetical protein
VSNFKSALLAGAAALSLAVPAETHAQIAINAYNFNDQGLALYGQIAMSGFADPSTVCGTDVGCQESAR